MKKKLVIFILLILFYGKMPLVWAQTTPTPTPTPTPTSSITNVTAITSPPTGTTVTTDKPTIAGTTIALGIVTIIINSPVITATVTANSAGYWSYTPTTIINNGTHTVTITARDPATGATATKTSSFIVAASGTQTTTTTTIATNAEQMVAGNSLPTFFLLVGGLIFIIIGLAPKIL